MSKTRLMLFIFIIVTFAVTIISYVFFDSEFLIDQWNIPLDPPGFYDSRQFAWAAMSYYQGYDPLIENPVNPRGHQLNYPRIWHLLFPLVVNESRTNIMGSIVVVLFFIGLGIFWFSNKFDTLTYLILSVIALSPAVMLGVERSNIELILFLVLSLALTIDSYSSISGLFLFLFASILKIYPVFGFVYLLKEEKRRFWALFLSASGIFFLYALFSLNDFMYVYTTTPKLVGSSFGINVWWKGIRHSRFLNLPVSDSMIFFFQILTYVLAIAIIAATLYLSIRNKNCGRYRQGQYIDAFRAGAGIYIGCFLLMNTVDYRLIFMIFTVPQLAAWIRDKGKGILSVPLITLMAMILSLWSFFIMRLLGRKITFVLEEFSNWVMLAGFLFLFFSSLPGWLSDFLRRPFSLIKQPEASQ